MRLEKASRATTCAWKKLHVRLRAPKNPLWLVLIARSPFFLQYPALLIVLEFCPRCIRYFLVVHCRSQLQFRRRLCCKISLNRRQKTEGHLRSPRMTATKTSAQTIENENVTSKLVRSESSCPSGWRDAIIGFVAHPLLEYGVKLAAGIVPIQQ